MYIPQIFKTKFYVQKEIEYNFVSTQGSVNQSTLDGWEGYLEQFRDRVLGKKLEWCEGEWISLA